MSFIGALKEWLESGDPTVRTWFLVNSYWPPFLSSAFYIFFVKGLGPDLMRDRKPFNLRQLMILYNFGVVFTYTWCLLTIAYYFLTTDAYKAICASTLVVPNHYTYTCTSAVWWIYILKYVELFDTVFTVLRKKDHLATDLHVIHHAAFPIIAWILLRTETRGFQFIPGVINAIVHTLMYTYYGLTAMKIKVSWKKYLTRLQMCQLVIILLLMFVAVTLGGCKTSLPGIYFASIFVAVILTMFFNFYTKTYGQTAKMNENVLKKKYPSRTETSKIHAR